MRWAARVDATQRGIIAALEANGADVEVIGLPVDLLVWFRGTTWVVEVKDGSKPPSERALTSIQKKFLGRWRGRKAVVVSIDDAIRQIVKGETG